MADKTKTVRLLTPHAILSYPHLFKPGPPMNEGDEPKFSACLVFVQEADISGLKSAFVTVGKAKWGDDFATMLRDGSLRSPFRKDIGNKGYPEGSTFINCNSKQKPGVVGADTLEIAQDEVYAGCIVRASVTAFAYTKGKPGVAFALNNVQKIRDGDRLDNRVAAADEFEAEMAETAASDTDMADLEDLI